MHFEVKKAVWQFLWVNSGFEGIPAEMKTSELDRPWRVSGRRFTEPGNKFRMYGYNIMVHGLPANNEALCVDHESDIL
jgi:hypothetical protein